PAALQLQGQQLIVRATVAAILAAWSWQPASAQQSVTIEEQQWHGNPLEPMEPQPKPPVRISTAGMLLCAARDAGAMSYCSDTKADWVGERTVDTSCGKGFYDPIHGGTCWDCPKDTDGRGGWLRSADHIESATACWRVPAEETGKATKVRSPAWAWDCPSGS